MVEQFRKAFENRYQIAQGLADQGKKVVGWVCTYIPEEIIYAGGMHPFRVVGSGEETSPIADAFLYSNNCSFARHCLEEGLQGKLKFLSGFVTCNACDHIRRLFDCWLKYLPAPYTKILGVPVKSTETTIKYFSKELIMFRREMEETLGVEIPEEGLRHAIELYNHSRTLLERLYELRKEDNPPVTGAEVAEVIRAGWFLPREEYNRMLEEFVREVEGRKRPEGDSYRVMIVGSELDSPDYLRIIEELGGWVVTDDLCCGTRYFRKAVEVDGDPFRALADRYLNRPFCPRMHPASERTAYLQQMAQEFRVEGLLHQTIKFCHIHGGSFPWIKAGCEEIGIPVLELEREYSLSGHGQLKTRVSAFYETLEGRRASI